MKTVLFLTIATVYVSCATIREKDNNLKEIILSVNVLLKMLDTEVQQNIFVTDPRVGGTADCKPNYFCKAAKVLSEKELPQFGSLIRPLNVFNNHHKKTCSVEEAKGDMDLRTFLEVLHRCAQKTHSTPKAPN